MESNEVVESLAALAHDSRLQIYRLLVEAGPDGVAASEIADEVGIPANTSSFHIKNLRNAGLVETRKEGRHIYYSANYRHMTELLQFLTNNCCGKPKRRSAKRSQ